MSKKGLVSRLEENLTILANILLVKETSKRLLQVYTPLSLLPVAASSSGLLSLISG